VRRTKALRALASLARLARQYGPGHGDRKLLLLAALDQAELTSAQQVLRLHELLCFLDAFPDDSRVWSRARAMLLRFRHRPDLGRLRAELAGTGIAGTDIPYRFYWPTARWISQRWPGALCIDRSDPPQAQAILEALPQLVPAVQSEYVKRAGTLTLGALERLVPRGVTDADWFIGLVAAMPGDDATREAFFDRVDPPFILRAGSSTPERTTARFGALPLQPQRGRLRGPRPDLRQECRRAPRRVVNLSRADAAVLMDLARISMATRERDLEVFQYANPRDAFLVDDGAGLGFAFLGIRPERRMLLPALYGGLTLQNGVPIGYVQLDVLGRHAEVSFNQFETFRDTGAARVFARYIAAAHHVFGCDSFSIEPYQLGHDNDEGITSGAWWFYQRLGFRPRSAEARRIAGRETRRDRRRRGYRSSAPNLRALARWHLYFSLDRARVSRLPKTIALLERAAHALQRFSSRDAAERRRAAALAAARWLDARQPGSGPSHVLADWAGIVLALQSTGRWSQRDRRLLHAIIAAKAGTSEREYLRLFLTHARLRRMLDC
jgi:hypothetical protein